jgi:hypothetical protein
MLVGINWMNHRVMFATFARANHALVWLNLLYLMVGGRVHADPDGGPRRMGCLKNRQIEELGSRGTQ